MSQDRSQKTFLIFLLVAISIAFVAMIRQFLITIVLAAIFAALSYPFHARLLRLFRGRRVLAALCTLVAFLLLVVGPTLGVLGIVAREALRVSQTVLPWIQEQLSNTDTLFERIERVEWIAQLRPYWTQILEKLGQVVASGGQFLVERLSDTTRGTVTFLFKFGIFLYTMFFFLLDGRAILRKVLYYLPLPDEDERRMVDRFLSVSRATLKGTLVIGLLQGGLTGLALAIAGIQAAVFWGTLAAVLSVVPGVGAALIWVPGVLYLFAAGQPGRALFLLLFCGGVVSTLDNFLRPRLVGHDVKMHDLLILFGTLGGLVLFGVSGFIVGPIVAALFVTIWEIYGVAFRDTLPTVGWLGPPVSTRAAPGKPSSPEPPKAPDVPPDEVPEP
jgi:predicted PurR-regulated permease PerM